MERYLFKIQKTLCMCKLWPENQIKTTTQFTLWFRVWIACQVSKLLEAADINCLTLNLTWGPNTSSVPHLLLARDDISVPLGISSFLFSNFLDWILRKIQVYIIYFGIKPQPTGSMMYDTFSFLSPIGTDVDSSDDILCSQNWVQTCERVEVDFRFEEKIWSLFNKYFLSKIGKQKLKLPVGELLSKNKEEVCLIILSNE